MIILSIDIGEKNLGCCILQIDSSERTQPATTCTYRETKEENMDVHVPVYRPFKILSWDVFDICEGSSFVHTLFDNNKPNQIEEEGEGIGPCCYAGCKRAPKFVQSYQKNRKMCRFHAKKESGGYEPKLRTKDYPTLAALNRMNKLEIQNCY